MSGICSVLTCEAIPRQLNTPTLRPLCGQYLSSLKSFPHLSPLFTLNPVQVWSCDGVNTEISTSKYARGPQYKRDMGNREGRVGGN